MWPQAYGLNEETLRGLAVQALAHPDPKVQAYVADEIDRLRPLVRFDRRWLKDTAPSTWRWEWEYQQRIYSALDRITRGECRRMMLFVPPRHTKTETVTVRYSAWRLERDPSQRVILGAYNQDQANLYSRKVRRIVQPRVQLTKDTNRIDEWETIHGGGLLARGVGGGVTGRGGDLIIIDDPVKSREEADSEAYRERCWDWYTNDLWTRQEPGCAILLILTRWHEDDLAGRLLQAQREGGEFAEQWEVLNFPALAEENDPLGRAVGEALCPERFDRNGLLTAKTVLGRNFYALYQGRPQAAEGAIFKAAWFKSYRQEGDCYLLNRGEQEERVLIERCHRVTTVDFAASEKKAADWTVVSTWGVTPARDLLLLDVKRERHEGPEAKGPVRNAHAKFHPAFIGIERNGLGGPLAQGLIEEGLPVSGIYQHLDKVTRALGAAARYEGGTIFHPLEAPWLGDWESELLTFPNGAHDDQVDTVSLAAQLIARSAMILSEFNASTHVATQPLDFDPHRPLVCGWSWLGGNPAWVVGQLDARGSGGVGQFLVLAALAGRRDEGVYEFASRVLQVLGPDAPALDLRHYAHPGHCGLKGETRPQGDAWLTLNGGVRGPVGYSRAGEVQDGGKTALGIRLCPVEGKREKREEVLRARLNSLVSGLPALVVDQDCAPVLEALTGGYTFKQTVKGLALGEIELNASASIVEALSCALWGLGTAAPVDEDEYGLAYAGTASGSGRRRW